jgi:SAM-dependent methyltransferase
VIRQSVFQDGFWQFDLSALKEGLELRGWVVSPDGWFGEASFTVNGRLFTSVEIEDNRPDVAQAFSVHPSRVRGFRCCIDWKHLPDGVKDYRFAYVDGRTLVPLVETQCKCSYEVDSPIPDPARRWRVAGTEDLNVFTWYGGECYGKLADTLERVFGRTFDDFRNVLDWGCGCGRVLRYVTARHTMNLTGVDIDPDSIGWCKSAFPKCTFHAIGLNPPMPLASESMDLVYGISIFTHLRERDQFLWLEELRRITRPGGVLLLSVHGNHAWFRSGQPREHFVEWKRTGFRDAHGNTALNEVISDHDYYRSVFHDIHYVIREWGKYFQIVQYIPGLLQDAQDLVVLVRE